MKKYSLLILLHVAAIIVVSGGIVWTYFKTHYVFSALGFIVLLWLAYSLYNLNIKVNKKLRRLFEAIQFQDFAITFRADNVLGESFKDLNDEMNTVIKSFNHIRSEREATLYFIQAIVQQINVGIISFTADGHIEIANQAAQKLLHTYRLTHLQQINNQNPEAYQCITELKPNESRLMKIHNNELSFNLTEMSLRDRKIKLLAIHNIQSELQLRELEAWQNLTKVLRHEIMNSVTPILSLTETMKDIVENDLSSIENNEALTDLKQALDTVIKRSKGIANFVNAYREFTTIPTPRLESITVSDLFNAVQNIFKSRKKIIEISYTIESDFHILIDSEMMEQVLINLIKNACEADYDTPNPIINVKAYINQKQKTIEVSDNGKGIDKTDAEKIFIPFYTSKNDGSGIGLSLSRQIVQLHGGTLRYMENKPSGAVFLIELG